MIGMAAALAAVSIGYADYTPKHLDVVAGQTVQWTQDSIRKHKGAGQYRQQGKQRTDEAAKEKKLDESVWTTPVATSSVLACSSRPSPVAKTKRPRRLSTPVTVAACMETVS